MTICKLGKCLALAALLAWPLAGDVTFAQRGDRGGDGGGRSGGGDRGGGSGDRGGGDRGGRPSGGREFSGGSVRGERGGSNRGGGDERSGGPSRTYRGDLNRGGEGHRARESQRSFYRGPQSSGDQNRARQEANRGGDNRGDSFSRDDDRDNRERRDGNRDDYRDGRNRSDLERFTRDAFGVGRGYGYRGDDIRRNWWRGYGNNDIPFRAGWWGGYYGNNWPIYSPYRYSRWSNRPNYWWGYTPAAALTDWVGFRFDRPRYWSYGPGANIYYQDDYVYYDSKRTIPVETYYQQIYDLAHSVPNISESDAENMDWKPLGVFAVGRDGEALSQRALQLAINQDGVITGTYFNRENGEVHPVSGMVDERTQRAAWAFADGTQNEVVFETALYNLTRQESTMMVHFGPQSGSTQVWQLVRLEQPESSGSASQLPQTTSQSLP
jgi:hypothetical protein